MRELGGDPSGRPSHPRRTKNARPTKRRRRRTNRADQVARLIREEPGITAQDIAKTAKINPTYVYRVLRELQKEGRARKQGREYCP